MANTPIGYDPTGLSPKIEILDENDVVQYTFESAQIAASPTEDFLLEEWNLHRGVNTDHGNCVITIDDPNKDLLDLTEARRPNRIMGTWKFKLYLGKNSTNINEWFRGFIMGVDTDFPNPVDTKHRLFVIGEGIKTSYYKTIMRFFQKKLSDGTTPDPADLDARVSELFKRLLEDTDHYTAQIPAIGFTVNGVQDSGIKVPDFQKNFDSIGEALNSLAQINSAYYGIDLGDAYMRRRDSVSSGFLVTNMDWDDPIKTNWNQDKVAYLHPGMRGWKNDFTDFGIAHFNALNVQRPVLDKSQTSANASLNLSSKHTSFPFSPNKNTVLKLAPFLSKVGTITENLTMKITGDDGTGKPNISDVRVTKTTTGAHLQRELGSSKHFEVLFNKIQVTPKESLHCVIDKYPDATNYITLDYQTGSGTYHDSTDGTTWTARTGNVKFREYAGVTSHVVCENTVASKRYAGFPRQMNVPMANFKSDKTALAILSGIAVTRGQERKRYPTFSVSAPTEPFGLGKTLRIVDIRSGLDINPNLIAYDMGGSAYDPNSNLGATRINLTIEEWGY